MNGTPLEEPGKRIRALGTHHERAAKSALLVRFILLTSSFDTGQDRKAQ
jgi:hypothetical protein